MKKPLLFALLTLFAFTSFPKKPNLDSLWTVWEDESQPDSIRLDAIETIAWDGYLYSQPDSAFYFGQLEYELAKARGNKKWMANALNTQGTSFYVQGDNAKAIDYYTLSLAIKEEIGDKKGVAGSMNNIGNIYKNQGDYAKAIDYYMRSLALKEEIGDKKGVAGSLNNIGNTYKNQGDYAKAIDYYMRSLALKEEIGDKKGMAGSLNNIGSIYLLQGDYTKAIDYYMRTLVTCEEIGDKRGLAISLNSIGIIYYNQGAYAKAIDYYTRSLAIKEEIGDKSGEGRSLNNIANIYIKQNKSVKAIEYASRSLQTAKEVGNVTEIREAASTLYEAYKSTGQHKNALEMYELHIQMRDSILSEENQREVLRQEYKYEYEKEALKDSLEFVKKEAVKDLEIEKQQANISRQRIALASTAGGLLLILALAFSIHRGKRRSDELLLNILPSETAKELKKKGYADAKQFDQVTVLFTDFKGFTQISERLSPSELVTAIDECFKSFDKIIENYNIEKIKTIGDAYMAAGGLPVPNKTNAEDVVRAAIEMRDWMLNYKKQRGENGFEIRIGIHTGPVVAGIVGIKKFQYDIWGDTVNTASRMESSGEVGKVNISETTYELVKDQFKCKHRGKIEAKGKGEVDMYFVERS